HDGRRSGVRGPGVGRRLPGPGPRPAPRRPRRRDRKNRSRKELTMYLTAYPCEGDPAMLAAAHERMTAHFALGATDLHLCVTTGDGIVVFDGCPSREVAAAFQQSGGVVRGAASA